KGKTEQRLWESRTYGEEDPLTAAWIIELVSQERCSLDLMVAKRLQETVGDALGSDFNAILSENRAGAHAFPVHRCVSATKKILDDTDSWQTTKEKCQSLLSEAGYWFEQELHRQLSHYHFNDFRFDAPELIYTLAGALQTGRLRREDPLIREVLEVIRAVQQQRSVYWRPYRPFLVKPQGLVLMPLSVEVADALLGTLGLTGHFDQLRDSLSSYYEWLMAQGKPEDSDMIGWRSENAFGPPEVEKIHTWTTSRVAIFLLNYSQLLDLALQSDLLQNSGLSFKEPRDLLAWKFIQPMDRSRRPADSQILPTIQKHFIQLHKSAPGSGKRLNPEGKFSMLLYSPPGTSKTSIAEIVANELDFKLVTITVSDFIVLGEQAVEQRAKMIFDVLSELKNVVVLFDEIDRLITDRESKRYIEQRDILQMMTPSMLTKFNDLKRKKKLIFVIATNYFERIDRAIKRAGRIDLHFVIPPFDQESRVELLEHFICDKFGEKGKDWRLPSGDKKRLEKIAEQNPLLIFEELKDIFDRSMSGVGFGDVTAVISNLEREIGQVKPSISIGSYDNRFSSELDPEKPYREYFFLCFLSAEVGQVKGIRKRFKERWTKWAKENARELGELTSDEWVREQLHKLGVAADANQPGEEGRKSHT
ncbi:MAG: ATP-binding protein, partial [Bacteroidetes bacterium]|nr:ATP-binding protein [Bacteroidota bacterium]